MSISLNLPDVRIADVETCDFGLIPTYETGEVLRAAYPDRWRRYLDSDTAREFIRRIGVDRRHLTQLPGLPPDPARLNAVDLARSAVCRLLDRRPGVLDDLDVLIFVSTSNPYPCISQAALLAHDLGIRPSCYDLKAGCSGGVLGILQAGQLVSSGIRKVLVVMAENLSHVTGTRDLRMVLTVGDGACCVLLEQHQGPGFVAALHGTLPEHARAMTVDTTFPPVSPTDRFEYRVGESEDFVEALSDTWSSVAKRVLSVAGLEPAGIDGFFLHQASAWQLDAITRQIGTDSRKVPSVIRDHGNMGSPTFAVAMAHGLSRVMRGRPFLMQAVGGGLSWCSIAAVRA